MQNDLVSRSALTACVVNKPSTVCQEAPYDHVWFTRLVDREQEILDEIKNAPAVDAVEVGSCDGCYWKEIGRQQKCSCCRRNRYLKDCYEGRAKE